MYINIKNIRWKNFLSYGEEFTEIKIENGIDLTIGKNGAGKCQDKNTLIEIEIEDGEILNKFKELRNQTNNKKEKLDATLGDISNFYDTYPEYKGKIKVNTRFGFKEIDEAGITAYDSIVYETQLSSGEIIKTSGNHRVIKNGSWEYVKNLTCNDYILTTNGYSKILSIIILGTKQDLYDLQVREVKEYYGNNVVSHNSTFSDSLFYSLFGKPFRKIKTGGLINSITKKNLVTEVVFNVNSKDYKVIRGQKPAKFEIYIGNEDGWDLIEQKATTKDYQKYLEEEILNLNETIFRQLVAISANLPSSKPFMELSQTEKESLFQVLTDTSIFTHINDNIKVRISDIKTTIKELTFKRDILNEALKSEQLLITQAEKQNNDINLHYENNISMTKEVITNALNNIDKYNNALSAITTLKEEYVGKNTHLEVKRSELTTLVENNSSVISAKRNIILEEYNKKISEVELNNNETTYNKIEEEIEKLITNNNNNKIEINDYTCKLDSIYSSEKNSIKCTSCNTINYITNISEKEINNKSFYIKEKNNLNKKIVNNNTLISNYKNEIDILKQEFSNKNIKEKEKILEEKNIKELELTNENNKFTESINALSININTLATELQNIKEKLLKSKRIKELLVEETNRLDYHKTKLIELENTKLVEVDYTKLNENKEILNNLLTTLTNSNTHLDDLNHLNTLIGANNLKGMVIKKQIPFLNKGINHFLELFSILDYSFVIDENFKERIISRTNDTEFNQLSNGQKARISFSIMFAFLRLIEERNGVSTNILILDEILDSSVDESGRDELLNILKSEFSSIKNIIIVSHNYQIREKIEIFNRLIHIKKDKFSSINIEEI